jgi:hypothetical protein
MPWIFFCIYNFFFDPLGHVITFNITKIDPPTSLPLPSLLYTIPQIPGVRLENKYRWRHIAKDNMNDLLIKAV